MEQLYYKLIFKETELLSKHYDDFFEVYKIISSKENEILSNGHIGIDLSLQNM